MLLSHRRRRSGCVGLRRMRQLVGIGSDLGTALFFQTSTQRLDVIINNGRLNEDQQLVSDVILCLIFEQVPQIRDIHQVRNAAIILGRLILNQSTQNDRGATGNGDRRRQTLAIDNRSLGPRYIDVGAKRIIDLGDFQSYLVVGVDQGDHLKVELYILVIDGRRNCGTAAVINNSAGGSGG